MVVGVSRHGGGGHGAELVGVVVRVHRGQVRAAVHPAEVGAGWGRVALAVAGRLVVGHGVRGAGCAGNGALHAGGVGGGHGLGQGGRGSRGGAWGDGRAPDGGDGADGGRGAVDARVGARARAAATARGRARAGRRPGAGHGRRGELPTALRARALARGGRFLLGRPGLGAVATLLLLPALGPPVLKPNLKPNREEATFQIR